MGLKEFYYGIEDKYYAFIEWLAGHGLNLKPLISAIESHGIPSMPLFLALILIVAGGLAVTFGGVDLSSLSNLTGGSTLSISVRSSAGPVDGALVSLAGDGVSASSSTVNGVASFSGIALGKRVRATITKDGFATLTRDFVTGGALAPFLLQTSRGEQILVLVVDQDSAPIARAQITYEVAGESRTTVTDSRGVARVTARVGQEVSLTITVQGFDTKTDSFTPDSPGYQHQVTMERGLGIIRNFDNLRNRAGDVPSPNDADDVLRSRSTNLAGRGTVGVTVLNSTGVGVAGAIVTLFSAVDSTVLATGRTASDGNFTFRNVPTGLRAYVGVDAEGWVSGTSETRVINDGINFRVTLAAISNTSVANLTVAFSEDGAPAAGGRAAPPGVLTGLIIFVVDADANRVIGAGERRARESTIVNLPAGRRVYVTAFSRDHVRYASEPFELAAGINRFNASLTRASPENSADVQVKVVDFYGAAVNNANVTPSLPATARLLLPAEQTGADGNAILKNVPLENIKFIATHGDFVGTNTTTVVSGAAGAGANSVLIQVLPTAGTANIHAVDLFSGADIGEPQFTISYIRGRDSAELASCPPTELRDGVCTLSLASGIQFTVVARATGYIEKTQTFTVGPNLASDVEVKMIPATDNQIISQTSGLTLRRASDGAEVGRDESLLQGEVYLADFNVVVPPHSSKFGVYLRIGSEGAGANDNAIILKGFPLDDPHNINHGSMMLRGSGSFTPASCGDVVNSNAVGTFKWLEASLASDSFVDFGLLADADVASSTVVTVPFLVTKSKPRNVTLQFRAFAATPDGVIRSPVDPVLGSNEESRARKSCASQTFATNYSIVAAANKLVQCGSQACLFLSFHQGADFGGEGFEVKPAIVRRGDFPSPLFLEYGLIDFNPNFEDGTSLSFSTDRSFISVLNTGSQLLPAATAGTVDVSVDPASNTYSANVKSSGKVDGRIATNPSNQARNPFSITLSYGNKVSIATAVNLVGLPAEVVALSPLPQHYVLRYDASDAITVRNSSNNREASEVDFLVDPLMPADALLVAFNFSGAACQQVTFSLFDESGCFALDENPKESLQLPDEYSSYGNNLLLLKYDASTDRCQFYSKNPNKVRKATGATLRVASTCTSAAKEIPLVALPNPALAESGFAGEDTVEFKPEYNAVVKVPSAWNEQGVAPLRVETSYVHVLINNRLYSKDNYVKLFEGTEGGNDEDAVDFRVLDNSVLLPVQSSRSFATLDDENEFLGALLGVTPVADKLRVTADPLEFSRIHPEQDILGLDNQADSVESTRKDVLTVLANTAFRRRQACTESQPCPFGMFPYNAFVSGNEPVKLHLGGELWTGKVGDGSINFENAGLAGEACDQRNQEGVYDYYWEYRVNENGNFQQDKKFTPLSLQPLDYVDFGCSVQQTNLCGKLSFAGHSCISTCGDGWYYDTVPGAQGKLCSGNNFKVDQLRPAGDKMWGTLWGRFLENLPQAALSCFATEWAGTYAGCQIATAACEGNVLCGQAVGRGAAFFVGKAYDLTLGEQIASTIAKGSNLGDKKGDLPGFSNTLASWAEYCSYANIAADTVEAIGILKGAGSAAAGATTSASNFDSCSRLATDKALSYCFCYQGALEGGLDVGFGPLSGGCFVEKAARALIDNDFVGLSRDSLSSQFARYKSAMDARKAASDRYSATVRATSADGIDLCITGCSTQADIALAKADFATVPGATQRLDRVSTALSDKMSREQDADLAYVEAKSNGFCAGLPRGDENSGCEQALLTAGKQLNVLDKTRNFVCGPALIGATALLATESFASLGVDERAYVQINKAGNTKFDNKVLGLFSTGPDVDCEDNTNLHENVDAYYDMDFSSLRVFNGKTTTCDEKKNIQTYANPAVDGGVNYKQNKATFYIKSGR